MAFLLCPSMAVEYFDNHVFVCTHVLGSTHPNFTVMFYACCVCSWLGRHCHMSCTSSGFMDDVMFSCNWLYDGMTLPQQHANPPAAWLRRVLDCGRCKDETSPSCRRCCGGVFNVPLPSLILVVIQSVFYALNSVPQCFLWLLFYQN